MNVEATLDYWKMFLASLPEQVEKLEMQKGLELQRKNISESKGADCMVAKEFYKRAVDVVYEESVGELKKVVNLALEFVFHDSKFQTEFRTADARGVKTLQITLKDLSKDPPMEVDIKHGIGAGLRTVVSVVMHIFYLINKNAYPVLFADEAYSNLSEEYVERFFTFLRGLCEKKGFHIVLISHDPRFLDYADKKYRVKDGVIEEVIPT